MGSLTLAPLQCSLLAPTDDELQGARASRDAEPDGLSLDGAPVEGSIVASTYHDLGNAAFWATFDLGSVLAAAKNYAGGTFDSRYVYFAPAERGLVARYDTQRAFTANDAWAIFDTTTVNAGAKAFSGAIFDGRYVYFVPYDGGFSGMVTRLDTEASFSDAAAWSTFDTQTVDVDAEGFIGGAFDGKYVYFVPKNNEFSGATGTVARYDTTGAFGAAGSWSTFDTKPLDTYANGFAGAVFDGKHLYLVPADNLSPESTVTRFDTQASFTAAASWSFFEMKTLKPGAGGFFGGAFDGKHVYLAPARPSSSGYVTRLDTTGSFNASWAGFDATKVSPRATEFAGAAFDGRHVYFVPRSEDAANGILLRHDTQGDFISASSWSTFDIASRNAAAKSFVGAIFDGQSVYFVPRDNGTVARFDAKTPPSLPKLPHHHGSFL